MSMKMEKGIIFYFKSISMQSAGFEALLKVQIVFSERNCLLDSWQSVQGLELHQLRRQEDESQKECSLITSIIESCLLPFDEEKEMRKHLA